MLLDPEADPFEVRDKLAELVAAKQAGTTPEAAVAAAEEQATPVTPAVPLAAAPAPEPEPVQVKVNPKFAQVLGDKALEYQQAVAAEVLDPSNPEAQQRLAQLNAAMTDEQRTLYGDAFGKFTDALNSMQSAGLSAEASADGVIELIEQVPAPSRAPLGDDAEEVLRLVREKSDAELDAARLKIVGLG